jgi:Protein of unknown function (DUF416)
VRGRLARLGRAERTAFAAACAERLWPLFVRYADVTGHADPGSLRTVLNDTWRAVRGEDVDLAGAQHLRQEMVPSDDGEWIHEMGYGQNAAAGVAYAVRTWLTDDPQEAAWAARQIYEAADYAAQHARPDLDFDLDRPHAEAALRGHPAVQAALAGTEDDLGAVESADPASWDGLRKRAEQDGAVRARSLS